MGPDDAVLGVDGCPGGWVGALVRRAPADGHPGGSGGRGYAPTASRISPPPAGRTSPPPASRSSTAPPGASRYVVSWHAGSMAELLALPAAVVAVDIPIGLPDGATRRPCDVQAAARLGAQRSSVFPAPPRAVLEAHSHTHASELSRAAGSVGVSLQSYNILGKVAEVDGVRDSRLVEVHPEVSFRELTGTVLPRKLLVAGRQARLAALRTWLPEAALPAPRPGRARPDDCLDALVCAWSGWRWLAGAAHMLGGDTDSTGLPMRIVI